MAESKSRELPKVYEPHQTERRWWQAWEQAGIFSPPRDAKGRKPFSIVIPPPNITGSLHMGHALNNTLQDILVRFHRMEGDATLWVFGMDHAGIATQNVVERQLKAEGKTRHDLGREAFIKRVWKWKEESGGTIRNQLKRLGCSLDYAHERFTMDQGLSEAVQEVFIKLYEEGKIYRAQRLINWCPRCHTALSDLEVEYQDVNSHLWHIRYPLEADPQDFLTVATTRPETMLGDTAVAVHPEDERYRQFIGKNLELPLVGRLIPIIADPAVDKEFGSGAVKVTPAHDFNDFEMGIRHGLEKLNVFTEDGRMNENAGHFEGQDRFECRKNLVKELEEGGWLAKVEEYKTSIGHCYRCKTIVEPYLSMQWFVKTQDLAKPAISAVKKGETRIIPKPWENTYFSWMENIRDWCISRQIWWGHRIPAWYCGRCAEEGRPGEGIIVSRTPVHQCPHCGHNDIQQDTDVLDTWFSSALWPFSTLGWPEKTSEFKTYYPTSALVTGFDIIFFWVARMMMMGLHFTKQVPFRDVYIHALVRDPQGQKMSKSKGNVIDPLDLMEKHGTDAFRFTLAALAAQGRDIKLSEERVLGYRNFCNKIWNAARFILASVKPNADERILKDVFKDPSKLATKHEISRWILWELSQTIDSVRKAIGEYRFNDAAMKIYQFVWGRYCDWFLEVIKVSQKPDSPEDSLKMEFSHVAIYVLDQSLKLLHPFMPFITEELWRSLFPDEETFIAISRFPSALKADILAEYQLSHQRVDAAMAIVEKVRQIASETGVPIGTKLEKVSVETSDPILNQEIDTIIHYALNLGRDKFNQLGIRDILKEETGIAYGLTRFRDLAVRVDLKGLVDIEKVKAKQLKELAHLENGLNTTRKMLNSQDFLFKAPEDLVEEKRQAEKTYLDKIQEVKQALERL